MTLELLLRPTFSIRAWICYTMEAILRPVYAATFKRHTAAWGHTNETLARFGAGTLGHDVYLFLSENGLRLYPKLEVHDIHHVLFGIPPTVPGEVQLQAILWGNGHKSLYSFMCLAAGFALFPEYHHDFSAALVRGRTLLPVHRWNFLYLLQENTSELRAFIEKKPCSAALLASEQGNCMV